jgi:hypothetical protein
LTARLKPYGWSILLVLAALVTAVLGEYVYALVLCAVALVTAGTVYVGRNKASQSIPTAASHVAYLFIALLLVILMVALAVAGGSSARPFAIIAAVCFALLGGMIVRALLRSRRHADEQTPR